MTKTMTKKDCKKIQVLLPALITTPEQAVMTEDCKKSIVSFKHCVKVELDTKKYDSAVAGVWNAFFDKWRGKEYDYLMITANDTELDPLAIDYAVETLEEHLEAGVCTLHVTRDHDDFVKNFGQQKRSGELTQDYSQMDPANFLIRKGVIETVGRIDEQYKCEFVERNYWWRCNLAAKQGYPTKWIEPKEVLNYHPPYAGTIGNDNERLQKALRKYLQETGGDAGQERFDHPYNDLSLDLTFTGEYK